MLHVLRSILVIFACGPLAALQADDTPTPGDTPPPAAVEPAAPPEPADTADTSVELQPIDLSGVTDRSPLAFEESPAYYAFLDRVRRVDPDALRQQAERQQKQRWEASPRFREFPLQEYPLFYDLTQRPDAYRGEPVAMRGHLIRLVKYTAGPNEYGIDTLYEGWLVTPDAETHPTTVVCTEIPEGMPIGEELINGVSVTGYFFKLHTYSSRDDKTRFAPMVLAHRLQWSPEAGATGWPVSQSSVILALVLLAAVGAIFAWISSRRSAAAKQQRLRESIPESPPEFLNDLTP